MNQPKSGELRKHGSHIEGEAEIVAAHSAALQHCAAEDLQQMDEQSLMTVQRLLQHGNLFGFWVTPQHWLVASYKRRAVDEAAVDLRERICSHLPPDVLRELKQRGQPTKRYLDCAGELEFAVLVMTRYLLLLRMGPVGMKRAKFQPLDVSTVFRLAYSELPPVFARLLAKRIKRSSLPIDHSSSQKDEVDNRSHFFSNFEPEDFEGLSNAVRKAAVNEFQRMRHMRDMGLWGDIPSQKLPSTVKAITGDRKFNEPDPDPDSHLPLPDEYVALMGQRSLWLIHELAPNLFTVGNSIVQLWKETAASGFSPDTIVTKRREGVQPILAEHVWVDSQGQPFEMPPFELKLPKENATQKAKRVKSGIPDDVLVWPPRGIRDFVALIGVVQMAHYFVLSLSMGARQSETMDLKRNALALDSKGRRVIQGKHVGFVRGKTFKLEQSKVGVMRDWLLPELGVRAFEQQVLLVRMAEQIGPMRPSGKSKKATESTHLWISASAGGKGATAKPLSDINKALATFARSLSMDVAPGGQNLRSHRFRKTLARLVALALTQAPKLLMEVFGHKNIEMTLYYILSDKELRSEIETVERELRVMRAKEVVERMAEADSSHLSNQHGGLAGYGGLGAYKISEVVHAHRRSQHRLGKQFGAETVVELAELLTFQGKAWEQVRHGVVCTKVPGQSGPCNKGVGRPEPSKCQSGCSHRLEEAFLRDDVECSIREALIEFESALSSGEELNAAFWAGQIRAQVPRFADLRDKWLRNSVVRSLFESAPEGVCA